MTVQYLDKRNGTVHAPASAPTAADMARELQRRFARMQQLQEELQELARSTAVLNDQMVKAVLDAAE